MRVVPSDVTSLIQKLFPDLLTHSGPRPYTMSIGNAAHLRSVLTLLDRIPEDLLVLSAEDFTALLTAIATIRAELDYWNAHGDRGMNSTPGFPNVNPVKLLSIALSKCPDSAASPATAGLEFISDVTFRESLRIDKSDADRALANGEFKGATVLAGSVLEALLLWALKTKTDEERNHAIAVLVEKKVLRGAPNRVIEKWSLDEYVEVATEMQLIRANTAEQARLAKNYRNLIHPGREHRLEEKCGRGQALGALAAVELAIKDLSGANS